MIPQFQKNGLLPPSQHEASWQEFVRRFGWNPHRRVLLRHMRNGLLSLRAAGCTTAYVDGSFVTNKDVPNDFDACWDATGVDLTLLDPVLMDFDGRRLRQKMKFAGEFFPATMRANFNGEQFLNFFQLDKESGAPKGIIKLDLRSLDQ